MRTFHWTLLALLAGLAIAPDPVAADAGTLRAIAVALSIDLPEPADPDSLTKALESSLERTPIPDEGTSLTVLGEGLGVLGALTGPDHAAAREGRTWDASLQALIRTHRAELLLLRASSGVQSDTQALGLLLTDRLYRPFVLACSAVARRHHTYLVAGTVAPEVDGGMRLFQSLRTFGDHPVRARVTRLYAEAFVFDPDGRYMGLVRKVNLTPAERDSGISPGRVADLQVFPLGSEVLGIAMGEDLEDPEVLQRYRSLGCTVLAAPRAHLEGWASSDARGTWVPSRWQRSLTRPLAPEAGGFRAVVSGCLVGNITDHVLDGQAAIALPHATDSLCFVGVDPDPEAPGLAAVTPWVVPDPLEVHNPQGPAISLADRRDYLAKVGKTLAPGEAREGLQIRGGVARTLSER